MWQVLPSKLIVGYFVLVPVAVFASIWALKGRPHIWRQKKGRAFALAQMLSLCTTVVLIITFVIGKWMWPVVVRIPGFSTYVYPDLNGEWSGAVLTNSSSGPSRSSDGPLAPVRIRAQIHQDLFGISVKVDSSTGSKSYTLATWPRINHDSGQRELLYVYVVRRQPKIPGELSRYHGTAWLTVESNEHGDLSLVGTYWTDKHYMERRNAAGQIKLTRN